MKKNLRIALCQINPTVGDIEKNSEKIIEIYREISTTSYPDLIVFPECSLTGYPPEDLVLRKNFLKHTRSALMRIAQTVRGPQCVIGFVREWRKKIYNSAAVIKNARIVKIYSKQSLPNYGVFDEKRYFSSGKDDGIFHVKGQAIGISICEDIWEENARLNPCIRQVKNGVKILLNLSASPYHEGKFQDRWKLFRKRIRQYRRPLLYVNLVGGQDELIFDGRSMALDDKGNLHALAKSFEEDVKMIEFNTNGGFCTYASHLMDKEPLPSGTEEIYQALTLGTKDYTEKNRFRKVLIGLSGGIDSALTACIAVDALGRDRVIGVTMPSQYSSTATRRDAQTTAKNLGISFWTIPIKNIYGSFLKTLSPHFKGTRTGIAEENLQSRIRGALMMALSNKWGYLVLTTGNKSETSVGYCTLYGDTAGGFSVLKDVPKSKVYQLSRFVNEKTSRNVIPQSTLLRAPTAELKPNQKDQDTLPSYTLLDQIIQGYVEDDQGLGDLIRKGYSKKTLAQVIRMIDSNEYKRRQSPPGIKITPKSFGKDRRMPITNRFREG